MVNVRKQLSKATFATSLCWVAAAADVEASEGDDDDVLPPDDDDATPRDAIAAVLLFSS